MVQTVDLDELELADDPQPGAPQPGTPAGADSAGQERDELDALAPVPEVITFADGRQVRVQRLMGQQFFLLLRIITHGAGNALATLRLDISDPAAFAARLAMLTLISIPDAWDETVRFVQSMVEPVGLSGAGRKATKAQRELDDELREDLNDYMARFDPNDMIDLVENVLRREATDLVALGKKLMKLFRLAQRLGAVPTSAGSPAPN